MGGGGGPVQKFIDDPIGGTINAVTNVATMGTVGYQDGRFATSEGIVTKTGVEGLRGVKQITGAQAAEDANNLARQQFDQQKIDAERARLEAQDQDMKNQIQQSRSAAGRGGGASGAGRSSASRASTAISNSKLGQDERDFLGL